MKRAFNWVMFLLTAGPVGIWLCSVGLVLILSAAFDCTIHEGFVNSCVVGGVDLGETAYYAGLIAAWGLLILGPISVGAGILWAVVAFIVHLIRKD
jgi:hypothetical protein